MQPRARRLLAATATTVATTLCLASGASAQPFHFEDSLRGGTVGNASGGAFGPDGWTVTGVTDGIWYALPRLASGSIEVTVANITLSTLVLPDHEIFAMYEAGYGITEPIRYSPEYRQNNYKMMLRLYGEAKRHGFMKMMWGICPAGAPGYFDAACACESFFAEPFADPGPWTGAPVRIRVEWGGGNARVLRDGVEVAGVDWGATGLTFGPEELHMMLGSPRNDGGLSAMPLGAVFSDLVVDGTIGPLATCGPTGAPDAGVAPDAGEPAPTTDGGAPGQRDAAIAVDATASTGRTPTPMTSGCACRASGRGAGGGLGLVGIALGVVMAIAACTRRRRA